MQITPLFHAPTGTWSYIVADPQTQRCAVLDPVLDFDYAAARTATASAAVIADHVEQAGLRCEWILETHAHADHLSAAQYLQSRLGGRLAIGQGIRSVQEHFAGVFDLEPGFRCDGSQFDHLFADGERFSIGGLAAEVIAVPGHTSDSLAYRIGDAVFVGDSLFMPDVGTARCDFPGGDAGTLYDSIRRLLALPAASRMFVCHDYPPAGRQPRCESSVAEQRAANIHMREGIGREQFIAMRGTRDASLDMPTLIYPAIQINIRAGALPPPAGNGSRYLRVPLSGAQP